MPTNATAGITATGGTSGIIVDNIVTAAQKAGASQIYYTTLGNATCSTTGFTGNNGCAVQTSQSAP